MMTWWTGCPGLEPKVNMQRTVNVIFISCCDHLQNGLVWRSTGFPLVFIPILQHQLNGNRYPSFTQMIWQRLCLRRVRRFGITPCLAAIPRKKSKCSGITAKTNVIGSKETSLATTLCWENWSPWVSTEMILLLTRGLKLGPWQSWGGAVTLHTRILRWQGIFQLRFILNMLLLNSLTMTLCRMWFPGYATWWTQQCFMIGPVLATHSLSLPSKGTWNLLLSSTGFTTTDQTHLALCVELSRRQRMGTWARLWVIFAQTLLMFQAYRIWLSLKAKEARLVLMVWRPFDFFVYGCSLLWFSSVCFLDFQQSCTRICRLYTWLPPRQGPARLLTFSTIGNWENCKW